MAQEQRKPLYMVLPLVIFLSGFSSLVYQVVWIREFSLLFGTHLLSTSTVLTVFMAGLSAGALLFGKTSDRVSKPVWILFFIQVGLALFAFLFEPLFHLVTNLYTSINQSTTWLAEKPDLSRFLLSAMMLIVPTTLMGGTLPVIVKLYTDHLEHLGNRAGSLYSINNIGAFSGGLLSGFFLLRLIGSHNTNFIAASVNLFNALLVLFIPVMLGAGEKKFPAVQKKEITGQVVPLSRRLLSVVLIITALEGFTMLVYEILWTRTILGFSYDKSSYVYTVVILGFLFGLSAGSYIAGRRTDKWKNLPGKFAMVEYGAGISALLMFFLFSRFSPHFYNTRLNNDTWFNVSGKEYLVFFVLTSIPAFFMGISYPLVGKMITDNMKRLGSRMGLLSFTDTIGSVAGPAVAGFLMLRYLDVYESFLICVFLNTGSGIWLSLVNKKHRTAKRFAYAAAGIVIVGVFITAFSRSDYYSNKFKYHPDEKIVAMKEGMTATVAVSKLPSGYMALSINGAKTAFTNPEDQRVHKMLAYLPWFFNPEAKNAAVIGFGLGITTRCLSDLGIKTTVAELSPEVLSLSSAYFDYVNQGIAATGKVKVRPEDGRSALLRSREKFGIITSNAVHPRLGSNLYTSDFYRLCSHRLTDNGVVCQWVPTNWMTENEFRSLLRSFTDVFPNARLWYVNRGHTLVIGSKSGLEINYDEIRSLINRPAIYRELADVDLFGTESVLSGFFMSAGDLKQWVAGVPPDTDDKAIIEYSFETDPRPNQLVLERLIHNGTDFRKCIRFSSDMDDTEKKSVLGRISENYTEHINYLESLCNSLAARDSLSH